MQWLGHALLLFCGVYEYAHTVPAWRRTHLRIHTFAHTRTTIRLFTANATSSSPARVMTSRKRCLCPSNSPLSLISPPASSTRGPPTSNVRISKFAQSDSFAFSSIRTWSSHACMVMVCDAAGRQPFRNCSAGATVNECVESLLLVSIHQVSAV